MFQPDGSVGDVYYDGTVDRPLGWIHLLVGRQEQVNPTSPLLDTETETANLMNTVNRWVSINHRTGTAGRPKYSITSITGYGSLPIRPI